MIRMAMVGLLTVVLVPPLPAAAAAQSWTVKARVPGRVLFSQVVAGSAKSAWAVGLRMDDGGKQTSYFFNGKKWRRAPFPKGTSVVGLPGMPPTLAASSAGAWALSPGEYVTDEDGSGGEQTDPCAAAARIRSGLLTNARGTIKKPSKLLRWSGGRWKQFKTFTNAVPYALAVRDKQVFAFGRSKSGKNVMLRFDGKNWRTSDVPLFVWNVQTTNRYLWVQGFAEKDGSHQVWRFDGAKWFNADLGRILPADYEPTKDKRGQSTLITSMSSSGRDQVSVSGFVTRDKLCPANETEFAKAEPFLLHFNGKTWRKDPLKGMKGLQIDAQVPDGRGGLYAAVSTAFGFSNSTFTLMHGTPGGTWTREKLPKNLKPTVLAVIPGGGYWATATGNSSSVILRK